MQRTSSATEGNELREGRLGTVLGYRLAKASAVIDQVFERHIGRSKNLRPVEFALLAIAQRNLGIGPARLADAVAISRPRATQLLDHLAARGLIERVPSAADGRGFEIHLTAVGSRLITEGLQRLQLAERATVKCLSEAELAILIELLERLGRAAEVEPF